MMSSSRRLGGSNLGVVVLVTEIKVTWAAPNILSKQPKNLGSEQKTWDQSKKPGIRAENLGFIYIL